MNFLIRFLVTAVAVAAAVLMVPGLEPVGGNTTVSIAAMALMFSLINVSIKPILKVLSFPITVVTLGIFYLILNALLFNLAGFLSMSLFQSGIYVHSFGAAFFGAIVVSIVSAIVNMFVGADA